jgi:hypothetical protein
MSLLNGVKHTCPKIMEVINGNVSPSAVSELREQGNYSRSAQMICALSFTIFGESVGLSHANFDKESSKLGRQEIRGR